MAHTETMPKSGLSLDGHMKVTMETLAILDNNEFAKRYREIMNYKESGARKPVITRWVSEADTMLKYFDYELRFRVENNEISLEEFATAVGVHSE